MNDLETAVKKPKRKSRVRKAFEEEWLTMGNHLVACAAAITAASGFSHLADKFIKSDAVIYGAATLTDSTSYWTAFMPQLL